MNSELIDISKSLISIPSTKESPDQHQKVLDQARLYVSGYPFKTFTCNQLPSLLIYNHWPKNGKFKVILNAHLDVVPGKPEQFSAVVKGNKLIGRGAIDMKAAAAAEILAFKGVAGKVKYPLALQLVTDEEIGGHKGTKYQISQGIFSYFYLCGEYSDNQIGCDTKGVLWLKLTTKGSRAHSAFLWNGINAITKLSNEIQTVSKLFPIPKSAVWKTTCNFGIISGGNTVNQVPDSASVTLDIRRIPKDSAGDIICRIRSHLIFADSQLEILEDEPANHADKNHPMIKQLGKSIRRITVQPSKYVKFHGASDARHYSAVGTTAIDIGPVGEGLHSDFEWVDIPSLETFHHILENFLLSL